MGLKFRVNIGILVSILVAVSGHSRAESPVEKHGSLEVRGNRILNQNGEPVQLRGMSFFWSQWKGKFYNRRVVDWLVEDWKVTVVRAAMGVKHKESESGYLYDGSEEDKVVTVVKASLKKGIYVIIDWHDHHAHENETEAVRFFEKMAARFGKHPNVIYEIYNEPEKVSWTETVKPYAQKVVQAIRKVDPDNLIIVGTPNWCQYVDEAAGDPLDEKNLAYTLHFYAASHGADLREKAEYALNQGLPLFVTEFGTTLASGDGFLNKKESENWFAFMDKHKLSWCNWSLADKDETSSALKPGARYYGRWKSAELTESGNYIRGKLREYAGIVEEPPESKRENRTKKKSWIKFRPLD